VPVKARMFALAVCGSTLLSLFTMWFETHVVLMGLLVAAMSFVSGLVSAYGRRAIGLSVSAVLALLFGMAANRAALMTPLGYTGLFLAGGVAYALFSLAASALLDIRNRRMFLGEAVHAFSAYLSAKAELYDPQARTRLALENLVEAHAAFTEKLQAARDFIFLGRRTASRQRWMAALLALLDCFDTVVSSDADIETMRQSGHSDLLLRLKALTAAFADDTEELALALNSIDRRSQNQFHIHLDLARPELAAALRAYQHDPVGSWSRFRYQGHDYHLTRLTDLTTQDPIKLVQARVAAAQGVMRHQTIGLIGATFDDGSAGFYLLNGEYDGTPDGSGWAEELEIDHPRTDCSYHRTKAP